MSKSKDLQDINDIIRVALCKYADAMLEVKPHLATILAGVACVIRYGEEEEFADLIYKYIRDKHAKFEAYKNN